MRIERTNTNNLKIEELPDGSKMIFDASRDTIVALNSTAGAAWDACQTSTTLPQIAENMRRTLSADVTDEFAESAVQKLEEKNLITTSGMTLRPTRREVLTTLSAIALPLVVSMTVTEQKAFAECANSGNSGNHDDGGEDQHVDRPHERLSKPIGFKD